MTTNHPLSGVSDVVGVEVRRVRDRKGWSIDELAARCAKIGAPHLTVDSLYALESGRKESGTGRRRRLVSVDEVAVLAHVLGVAPDALLVPVHLGDADPYPLTPGFTTTAGAARRWLRGEGVLSEWVTAGPRGTAIHADADSDNIARLLQHLLEKDPGQLAEFLRKSLGEPRGGEDAGDPQDRSE